MSGEGGKIASYRWLLGLSRESEFMSCVKSRGGRPGLFVLMSLTVSVDVKQH